MPPGISAIEEADEARSSYPQSYTAYDYLSRTSAQITGKDYYVRPEEAWTVGQSFILRDDKGKEYKASYQYRVSENDTRKEHGIPNRPAC